ncbi:VCBS domain-containing protein, partial [Pseudomonas guariconensis]|uniref:Ig-like domain-containing protein n=1 Tax=Pseudomonas guariconensis TaxID=1288410 RepID=UPI00209B1FEE
VVGADVVSDGKYVVGVRAGNDTSTSATGQLNTQVMGQYGYLTLDAQGNALYHANPNSVAPAGATDTFVYTIRDADGDESTTTITIRIDDCSLVVGDDTGVMVYEKSLDLLKDGNDLAAGTVEGSDPHSTGETASGSLASSVSGGVGTLTFSLVGNAVGQYGQIQLNSDGTYTYTLTSAPQSPNPGNDGPNTVTESFTYQVKDSQGNSTTSTIVITIVDDVPRAHCDETSVIEGGTVSGNVLDNDIVGADVVSDGKYVVGVRAGNDASTSATGQLNTQVMGQYGYLTLDAQGNAVYHANPNSVAPAGATDTFVYTIRDADGDESTTTITINVRDSKMVACEDRDVTVYEKALDLCKDGHDLAAGTVTGSDPHSTGETASGSLAGSVIGGVGALTYSLMDHAVGQYGQIHLNSNGTYTYTLTSAPKSPTPGNDGPNTVTESFTYQVKDSLGNTTTNSIVITIVDDVPRAHCDETSVIEGRTVTGNVLDNDIVGADVVNDGKYVVGVRAGSDTSSSATGQLNTQVMGQYGYLTLDAKGNAVYHAKPNSVPPSGATDTFVYTIRDADGDESTTTITINVRDSKMVACEDRDVTVYEKALDLCKDGHDLAAGTVTGSDPHSTGETASGSLAGSVIGGVGALTYSLMDHAVGQYGQIHLNSNGTYTYTLTSAPKSPTPGNDGPNTVTESFTYQVKDSLGNTTTNSIVITIVDDVPRAHCDETSVIEGRTVTGNVLDNDIVGADVVNDGKYVVGVRAGSDTSSSATGQLNTQVMGQYGYLTLDAKGNAVYHAKPNSVPPSGATDTFVYTIRDADGDESTTTITINVRDSKMVSCWDSDTNAYQKILDLHRSAFSGSFGSMTAALVIAGYLGAISNGNANEGDVINVTLRKGETLKLDHDHPMGNLMMEWKAASGGYQAIANGDSFTASHDGVYSIHLARAADASGNDKAAEKYNLNMLIDYSHAERGAFSGSDTHNDHPGGSASATASIVYPGEHTLDGTPGDDVLVGGEGNDTLQGGDGDDLLIGGAGIDTASYASADAGVVVDLSAGGPQDTGGAGIDTLVGIENLIGSDHDDTLIGNGADNLLIAGLGNDVLKGGAGNDILIGGPGNDTLSGGSGNDTFVWQKGDTGHDTVTDFTPGSDSLDLSQLLQGESASAASLDDYLHFKVNGTGTEVVSTIEVSSVAGAAPTQTIDLAGVDLAQHYGVAAGAGGMIAAGQDTATIINGMLNDHSLKVDTV